MGAKILLHFSKEALANIPQIIKGYLVRSEAAARVEEITRAANLLKSVEEKSLPLEEVSSSAS